MQGDLKMETVIAAMRSCFPEFRATRKQSRSATAYVAQHEDSGDEDEPESGLPSGGEEMEAFLAEHGFHDSALTPRSSMRLKWLTC